MTFRGLRLTQGNIGIEADEGRASKLDFQDSVWHFSGNVIIDVENGHIECASADLQFKNNQLEILRGHVLAISSNGDRDTEIRTQYLELDPENYRAETNERVQIRIGARSITATGMVASLQDNHLVLKSNVSGKFVP